MSINRINNEYEMKIKVILKKYGAEEAFLDLKDIIEDIAQDAYSEGYGASPYEKYNFKTVTK